MIDEFMTLRVNKDSSFCGDLWDRVCVISDRRGDESSGEEESSVRGLQLLEEVLYRVPQDPGAGGEERENGSPTC